MKLYLIMFINVPFNWGRDGAGEDALLHSRSTEPENNNNNSSLLIILKFALILN